MGQRKENDGEANMSSSKQHPLESSRHDWRELAIEHLPRFRDVILAATSHIDLWKSLLDILSEAGTDESRRPETEAIYEYAWWCVALSGDVGLAAEVGTHFYEDLSFYSDFDRQVPLFITPSQFEKLEPFFRYRLTDEEFVDFHLRFAANHAKNSN
jgi:hypothetical protein